MNEVSLKEFLTRHGKLDEMLQLYNEAARPEDLDNVKIVQLRNHIFIAQALSELQNENLPVSLIEKLRAIEQEKQISPIAVLKIFSAYAAVLIAGIVVVFIAQSFLQKVLIEIALYSAGVSFIFYQALKQKITSFYG